MLRSRIERGASLWENEDGLLRIEIPLPHVARVTFLGHFTDEFVEPIGRAADRTTLSGRHAIAFHDWEGMTNYEMSARARLLGVAARNHSKTECIHFIVRATMVKLAIQVANFTIGKFELHPGPRSFEDAYKRTLALDEEDVERRLALTMVRQMSK